MKETFYGRLVEASASKNNSSVLNLRFVFTDFEPNSNSVVVPLAEAENIRNSAIFMPIKINFTDNSPAGHSDSLPIGVMASIDEEPGRLIGNAFMWKEEFPNIAQWIEDNLDAVQFSWELWTNPELSQATDDNGNKILRGIEVKSTVIVDNPAYDGRTRLLEVSEKDSVNRMRAEIETLRAQLEEVTNRMSELEQDNTEVEVPTEAEVDEPAVTDDNREVEGANDEHAKLLQELEELRQYRDNIESEKLRNELIRVRKTQLSEAGIVYDDAKFAARLDFILSLDDVAFSTYVEDLASVAPKRTEAEVSSISAKTTVPDPVTSNRGRVSNVKRLATELRKQRYS